MELERSYKTSTVAFFIFRLLSLNASFFVFPQCLCFNCNFFSFIPHSRFFSLATVFSSYIPIWVEKKNNKFIVFVYCKRHKIKFKAIDHGSYRLMCTNLCAKRHTVSLEHTWTFLTDVSPFMTFTLDKRHLFSFIFLIEKKKRNEIKSICSLSKWIVCQSRQTMSRCTTNRSDSFTACNFCAILCYLSSVKFDCFF